jgi:2-dehydro-3-deoxyphosphogluconate aldolase/(4S)-4-hydroxy-2-oxoglutarate aldolase
MTILETIGQHRLVPIITIDSADHALPLADALVAGGLPVMEVTFRTPAAEASIRAIAKRGDVLIGAGTVLSVDLVKKAVDAGATFMVTPGFDPKVVEYCVSNKIPITPGTITPTDLSMALNHGVTTVKFFPAESFGGIKTLKAIAAPFGMMTFLPTGGITPATLRDYLSFKPVLAVGGSWFATRELLAAGRYDEIARLTRDAVAMVKSA